MATLAEKKLLDAKGPFGSNVFKNPAWYIRLSFTILSGKDSKIIIKKVNLYWESPMGSTAMQLH